MKIKDRIKHWLDIRDYSAEIKGIEASVVAKLDEATATLKTFSEVACSGCEKKIYTYPYGGGYYRDSDGCIFHSGDCMGDFRARQKESVEAL